MSKAPQIVDPFRAVAEIARLINEATELPPAGLIGRVLEAANAITGLMKGNVAVVDYVFDEIHLLRVDVSGGRPPERETIASVVSWTKGLPRPAELSRERPTHPGDEGTLLKSKPILVGTRHFGELHIFGTRERLTAEKDEDDLLESLASLTAVALERCQRQRDSLRLREWLDAFSRVFAASRIPTSASQVEPLLQEIADNARRLTKADFVVLYEYFQEANGGDVRLPPTLAGPVQMESVLRTRGVATEHKRSAVFRLLQQGQPFYAHQAIEEWQAGGLLDGPASERSFFARENVVSSAGLPLRIEKEYVGALFVNYRTEFAFPEEFREHLELFANQAALAIGNARFFLRSERYSRDLQALNRIGRELCSATSRDIEQIGRLIDEKTQEIIASQNFFVCVYDSDTDRFRLPYVRDLHDTRHTLEPKLHLGLTGYVCRTALPLLATRDRIEQLIADGSAELVGEPAAIWLGAPLLIRDRVIGALVVQDYSDEAAFNDEHLRLLEAVASQAAIAIDNYRLLSEGDPNSS